MTRDITEPTLERSPHPAGRRWLVPLIALLALAGASLAASARAASVSSNWAGYAVTGKATKTRITRVVGAWTQPSAVCSAGRQTYSAFWVGLGGYQSGSSKLEQTGTEADCSRAGQASYSAWYELVPNPPVSAKLLVRLGDSIAASVTASSSAVVLHLRDLTSGRVFSKRVAMRLPSTSSAEWIAEAPSACNRGSCSTLPLTDFGTVSFAGASASASDSHTGAISDGSWRATAIELRGDLEALSVSSGPVFDGATPSAR